MMITGTDLERALYTSSFTGRRACEWRRTTIVSSAAGKARDLLTIATARDHNNPNGSRPWRQALHGVSHDSFDDLEVKWAVNWRT